MTRSVSVDRPAPPRKRLRSVAPAAIWDNHSGECDPISRTEAFRPRDRGARPRHCAVRTPLCQRCRSRGHGAEDSIKGIVRLSTVHLVLAEVKPRRNREQFIHELATTGFAIAALVSLVVETPPNQRCRWVDLRNRPTACSNHRPTSLREL